MPEQISAIELKLVEISAKLDAVSASMEKTRKYMFWSVAIPLAMLLLPLLAIPFVLPLLNTYVTSLGLPSSF